MPLCYRYNVPEKPRPKALPETEVVVFEPGDNIDYRPRTLYFRHRDCLSNFGAKIQPLNESPERPNDRSIPQESEMAKAKKTAAPKKANTPKAKKTAAPKTDKTAKPGVIKTIVEMISRQTGASADEILTTLVKMFPERNPDGMRKTILIQANRNKSSKEKDEKRGLVYFNRRGGRSLSADASA